MIFFLAFKKQKIENYEILVLIQLETELENSIYPKIYFLQFHLVMFQKNLVLFETTMEKVSQRKINNGVILPRQADISNDSLVISKK